MEARWLAVVTVCVWVAGPAPAGSAVLEMTYEEVLEAALSAPGLSRLAARLRTAEAAVLDAGTYPYNPEIEIEGADRDAASGATTDRGVRFAQRLELAGQRRERLAVAEAALTVDREGLARARRELLAEAALTFAEAATRRDLVEVERSDAELARDFASLVERRLEAGAATAVEVALAQAGLARAERGLAVAEGLFRGAQARLAEVTGAAEALVAPVGGLPESNAPTLLDDLVAEAMSSRRDLAAARVGVEMSEARLRLARAERVPDLTVEARASREEDDDLVGLGLAVPLPLFERNQGRIAEAEAAILAAEADLAARELAVRREVAEAHGRLTASLDARRLADRLGVTPLEEGLALLERAFEAGKIGAAELLLYRRELVEGQRRAIEARAQVWEAATALAVATGTAPAGAESLEDEEVEP